MSSPELLEALEHYISHEDELSCYIHDGLNLDCENIENNWNETALHYASEFNLVCAVKRLLRKGADVNALDPFCNTPLMIALKYGSIETGRMLLSKGADINITDNAGNSCLHIAAKHGLDCLVSIIAKRANINAENNLGETPIQLAIQNKHEKTTMILVQYEAADISSKDNDITLALEITFPFYFQILKADGKPEELNTLILEAVDKGWLNMAFLLLEKGANMNHADINGKSLVYISVQKQKLQILKLLVSRGANTEKKDNNGDSPLRIALGVCDSAEYALLIIKGGLSIETLNSELKSSVTNKSMTPIDLAISRKWNNVCCALMDYGATKHSFQRCSHYYLHRLYSIIPEESMPDTCIINDEQIPRYYRYEESPAFINGEYKTNFIKKSLWKWLFDIGNCILFPIHCTIEDIEERVSSTHVICLSWISDSHNYLNWYGANCWFCGKFWNLMILYNHTTDCPLSKFKYDFDPSQKDEVLLRKRPQYESVTPTPIFEIQTSLDNMPGKYYLHKPAKEVLSLTTEKKQTQITYKDDVSTVQKELYNEEAEDSLTKGIKFEKLQAGLNPLYRAETSNPNIHQAVDLILDVNTKKARMKLQNDFSEQSVSDSDVDIKTVQTPSQCLSSVMPKETKRNDDTKPVWIPPSDNFLMSAKETKLDADTKPYHLQGLGEFLVTQKDKIFVADTKPYNLVEQVELPMSPKETKSDVDTKPHKFQDQIDFPMMQKETKLDVDTKPYNLQGFVDYHVTSMETKTDVDTKPYNLQDLVDFPMTPLEIKSNVDTKHVKLPDHGDFPKLPKIPKLDIDTKPAKMSGHCDLSVSGKKTKIEIDTNLAPPKDHDDVPMLAMVSNLDVETKPLLIPGRSDITMPVPKEEYDVNTKQFLTTSYLDMSPGVGKSGHAIKTTNQSKLELNRTEDTFETDVKSEKMQHGFDALYSVKAFQKSGLGICSKASKQIHGKEHREFDHMPLHRCVLRDDIRRLDDVILESCKNTVDVMGNIGWTPLHLAIALQNHEAVKVLLKYGADINITSKCILPMFVIHSIFRKKYFENPLTKAKFLFLLKQYSLNDMKTGLTPLQLATYKNVSSKIIQELVYHHDVKDDDIKSCLELSFERPCERIILECLRTKAEQHYKALSLKVTVGYETKPRFQRVLFGLSTKVYRRLEETFMSLKMIIKNPEMINRNDRQKQRPLSVEQAKVCKSGISAVDAMLWSVHNNLNGISASLVNDKPTIVLYCEHKGFIPITDIPFITHVSVGGNEIRVRIRDGSFKFGTGNRSINVGSSVAEERSLSYGTVGPIVELPNDKNATAFVTCAHVFHTHQELLQQNFERNEHIKVHVPSDAQFQNEVEEQPMDVEDDIHENQGATKQNNFQVKGSIIKSIFTYHEPLQPTNTMPLSRTAVNGSNLSADVDVDAALVKMENCPSSNGLLAPVYKTDKIDAGFPVYMQLQFNTGETLNAFHDCGFGIKVYKVGHRTGLRYGILMFDGGQVKVTDETNIEHEMAFFGQTIQKSDNEGPVNR